MKRGGKNFALSKCSMNFSCLYSFSLNENLELTFYEHLKTLSYCKRNNISNNIYIILKFVVLGKIVSMET